MNKDSWGYVGKVCDMSRVAVSNRVGNEVQRVGRKGLGVRHT